MNIKYLFVFCLGVTAGSIFTARFLDEKYSKIADEEIESVKEISKKTIGELKKKIENVRKNEVEKIQGEKNGKTLYHELADQYKESGELPVIEVISDQEYSDGDNEKMTVWFYGIDRALLDDSEQPIENVEDCIGKDIIDVPQKYFNILEGKTTVFLRNHSMAIDFEIIYLDKSYSRDVLGLEE